MIEIAPEEYWVKTTFNNIQFYLFSLSIDGKVDWRLPHQSELVEFFNPEFDWDVLDYHWVFDDLEYNSEYWNTREFTIIPVRDLKDD